MRDIDADQWAAHFRDEEEVKAIERDVDRERGRELDEMVSEYKRDRKSEQMKREYRRAVRKRDALVADWLANARNLDIAHCVRELVKNAGPGVIDLVEVRREMATKPKKRRKRDRLGIL